MTETGRPSFGRPSAPAARIGMRPRAAPWRPSTLAQGIASTLPTPERTALFIDGPNLYATSKALGFDVDFRRLLAHHAQAHDLVRAHYYTAIFDDQEYSSLRPLVDWLDYNGYRVVTKPAREFIDSMGRRRFKGNLDIELAIDAMELAPRLDRAILFSGDGDFRRLVEALQRQGVVVTVVSTIRTQPAMVADELRRQADAFVDLQSLAPQVARNAGDRPPRTDDGPDGGPGLEQRYGIRQDPGGERRPVRPMGAGPRGRD